MEGSAVGTCTRRWRKVCSSEPRSPPKVVEISHLSANYWNYLYPIEALWHWAGAASGVKATYLRRKAESIALDFNLTLTEGASWYWRESSEAVGAGSIAHISRLRFYSLNNVRDSCRSPCFTSGVSSLCSLNLRSYCVQGEAFSLILRDNFCESHSVFICPCYSLLSS